MFGKDTDTARRQEQTRGVDISTERVDSATSTPLLPTTTTNTDVCNALRSNLRSFVMSVQPPNPHLQNPISGTTIDTSPQTLGLDESPDAQSNSADIQPPNRRSSASKGVIKRTVESTAAKLGGSVLGGGSKRDNSSPRLSASFTSSPKRFLSLTRKGKAKDTSHMTISDGRGESGEHLVVHDFRSVVSTVIVSYIRTSPIPPTPRLWDYLSDYALRKYIAREPSLSFTIAFELARYQQLDFRQ